MHSTIQSVIYSLDGLGNALENVHTDTRTMAEMWGWQYPPLTRFDLARLANNLSLRLRENNIDELTDEMNYQLQDIPNRINIYREKTIQNLSNTNALQATQALLALIEWISRVIEPLNSWQVLQDNKALPNHLAKKLRAIQSELNQLIPEKEQLLTQIHLIRSATEAAESLPTDLETLSTARSQVNIYAEGAGQAFGKIETYVQKVEDTFNNIARKKEEADKLVAQCETAYSVTTTKGLAGAFTQRADKLSTSMWLWVGGLLVALITGGIIGAHRFEVLNQAMNSKVEASYIWIQIFLSVISFGAPIWLAWISTKQISQRFKLAEDYAYKASIAKAYEGYRKEAARIDPEFEKRLFSSSLSRLEEQPLRVLEKEEHHTPFQELINSAQFQKAIEIVPGLKEKYFKSINRKFKVVDNIEDLKKELTKETKSE